MNALTRNNILARLKSYAKQVDSFKVTLTDSTQQMIAKGPPATPWKPMLESLDGLPWMKLELLDKRGALVGAPIENNEAATELENLPSLSSRTTEVAQISQIVGRQVNDTVQVIERVTRPAWDALVQANAKAHELADVYRGNATKATKERDDALAELARVKDKLSRKQDALEELTEKLIEMQENPPQNMQQTVADIAKAIPEVGQIIKTIVPLAGRAISGLLGPGKVNGTATPPPATTAPKPAGTA